MHRHATPRHATPRHTPPHTAALLRSLPPKARHPVHTHVHSHFARRRKPLLLRGGHAGQPIADYWKSGRSGASWGSGLGWGGDWLRPGRRWQNVAALGTALARLPKCGASESVRPREGDCRVVREVSAGLSDSPTSREIFVRTGTEWICRDSQNLLHVFSSSEF
jgi:hypothetical protein